MHQIPNISNLSATKTENLGSDNKFAVESRWEIDLILECILIVQESKQIV